MVKKYGIISDIHRIDPTYVALGVDTLRKEGIDGLVLNGDIIGDQFPRLNNQEYLSILLNYIASCGIETYILPGSHETVGEVEPIVRDFQEKFPNLIYVVDEPVINKNDHELVFLPGSDWRSGEALEAGYSLGAGQYETGLYKSQNESLLRMINMNDLKRYVKDPDKVVLFSHVPRRFSNPDVAVDMAEFGEVQQTFYLNGHVIEKGSVFPAPIGYQLANAGFPIKVKKENRGNEDLSKIINELGIKKHITAHFHESVHRAHNSKEEQIKEGEWVNELFFMASYMDGLKLGLLEVDNEKVKYYRINLKEIFKIKAESGN